MGWGDQLTPARDESVGEAEARKARSVAQLDAEGIPVLATLPFIETEAESKRRESSEVALRALALAAVAVKGEAHGEARSEEVMTFTQDLVARFNLVSAFSPAERRFIEEPQPSERDRIQFTWRYESY